MTPVVANVAQALIALKDAQHYVRQVGLLLTGHKSDQMGLLASSIEKAQLDLVEVAMTVQNSAETR